MSDFDREGKSPSDNLLYVQAAGNFLLKKHLPNELTGKQVSAIKELIDNLDSIRANHKKYSSTQIEGIDQAELLFLATQQALNLPPQINIPKLGKQAFIEEIDNYFSDITPSKIKATMPNNTSQTRPDVTPARKTNQDNDLGCRIS